MTPAVISLPEEQNGRMRGLDRFRGRSRRGEADALLRGVRCRPGPSHRPAIGFLLREASVRVP
jgi:hypothetical protein